MFFFLTELPSTTLFKKDSKIGKVHPSVYFSFILKLIQPNNASINIKTPNK